jgi:tetratricopeptide (TPR) repeat protein
MSRLADRLMGMDRGMSRREGLGRMPLPTASADGVSLRWRPGVVLVIVVVSAVMSVTTLMLLRTRSVAPDGTAALTPTAASRAIQPERPSAGLSERDKRFVALSGQGFQAAQDGALGEAIGLFTRALEVKPTDADTWNTLGVVLTRRGETARGADAFGRALRVNPVHVEAHRNLAVLLDGQGRFREAAAHYRAFLTLSAENHPARDEVRRRLAEMPGLDSRASKPE